MKTEEIVPMKPLTGSLGIIKSSFNLSFPLLFFGGSGFKIEFLPQTKIVPASVTTQKKKERKEGIRSGVHETDGVNKVWTLVDASC